MLPVAQEMRSERTLPLPVPGSKLSAKMLSHNLETCESDITPIKGEREVSRQGRRGEEKKAERVREMSGM